MAVLVEALALWRSSRRLHGGACAVVLVEALAWRRSRGGARRGARTAALVASIFVDAWQFLRRLQLGVACNWASLATELYSPDPSLCATTLCGLVLPSGPDDGHQARTITSSAAVTIAAAAASSRPTRARPRRRRPSPPRRSPASTW